MISHRINAVRLIPRRVKLDLGIVRQLHLTWGQRRDGCYVMTKEGWVLAAAKGAVRKRGSVPVLAVKP